MSNPLLDSLSGNPEGPLDQEALKALNNPELIAEIPLERMESLEVSPEDFDASSRNLISYFAKENIRKPSPPIEIKPEDYPGTQSELLQGLQDWMNTPGIYETPDMLAKKEKTVSGAIENANALLDGKITRENIASLRFIAAYCYSKCNQRTDFDETIGLPLREQHPDILATPEKTAEGAFFERLRSDTMRVIKYLNQLLPELDTGGSKRRATNKN